MDNITALLDLIATNGAALVDACKANNVAFTSLDEPFKLSDSLAQYKDVSKPADILVAAARQLILTVQDPVYTTWSNSFAWTLPAVLKVIVDLSIPEILHEAGPEGLHVDEIASKVNIDPGKTARMLRLCSTAYIFREVKPDVFAINKLGSILSTGKPFEEVNRDPASKHDNTWGIPAHCSVISGFSMKVGNNMYDNIVDPKSGFSQEPEDSTFHRVYGHQFFDWLSLPENELERKKFSIAMSGIKSGDATKLTIKALSELNLPDKSLIVDVGGGVGSVVLELAEVNPHLLFEVQDLPTVVKGGERWFRDRMPQALDEGRVTFRGLSFFEPQPTRSTSPSVFYMRLVAHDWSDKYFDKILIQLRAAVATPSTYLVVQDNVLTTNVSAGVDVNVNDGADDHVEVTFPPPPPPPIPANLGRLRPYEADILMMNTLNAQERTLSQFKAAMAKAGWKLKKVEIIDTASLLNAILIAVPM